MTNAFTESKLKEFDEKYKDNIKNISIGQYDSNGVNIGYISAKDEIKSFLQSAIDESYEKGFSDGAKKFINKKVTWG